MRRSNDLLPHARIQGGGGQGVRTPSDSGKHKAIECIINTGLVHLENHKTTKPALNNGPSWAQQRNTI